MVDESISASIGDKKIAIRGLSVLVVVILALALSAVIYYIDESARHSSVLLKYIAETNAEGLKYMIMRGQEHEVLVQSLKELRRVNEETNRAIDEQSYIILMPEYERRTVRLRLRMPESLRRKLEDQHHWHDGGIR